MNDKSRMAIIETEIKNITKTLDQHITDQNNDFDNLFRRLSNLDKRFAGKWVETVSIVALASLISGIVLFMLNTGGI